MEMLIAPEKKAPRIYSLRGNMEREGGCFTRRPIEILAASSGLEDVPPASLHLEVEEAYPGNWKDHGIPYSSNGQEHYFADDKRHKEYCKSDPVAWLLLLTQFRLRLYSRFQCF